METFNLQLPQYSNNHREYFRELSSYFSKVEKAKGTNAMLDAYSNWECQYPDLIEEYEDYCQEGIETSKDLNIL